MRSLKPARAVALLVGVMPAVWAAALPALARAAPAVDAPPRLETDGTFGRLFLQLTSADARALDGPELDLRWTMSNDWSTPTTVTRGGRQVTFQLDEQTDSLTASVRTPWSRLLGPGPALGGRPLFERLSSALELRLTEQWGGWTDGPIEAWHGLIQCINFQRELYPRNQVNVTLRDDANGAGIDVHGARLAVGDVVLRTQLLVAEAGESPSSPGRARWAASVRLDLKAPLGSPTQLGGSGGWDAGLSLLGTGELAPWLTAHALLGVAAYSGIDVPVPMQPRTWHTTAEITLVAHWGDWALVFDDRLIGPIFEDGWVRVAKDEQDAGGVPYQSSGMYGAFRAQNQLSGALRWQRWMLWFTDEWTPGSNPHSTQSWFYDSNAPDVTIGLAYTMGL